MRKIILTLFFLSSFLLGTDKDNILPYPIHQTKLANDLNIVTIPFDSPGIVSFYIVVRVGARDEVEKGVTGFAHFFEHMMFRGTDKYPKEKYSAVLKSIGASANANTTQDRTLYVMTGDATKLELMFELESDRFKNLNYSEHDFKTEAGAVKGEYTKNYASPYQQIFEQLQNTAFDKHTYKHTTMGFFDDIVDMPNQFEYSREFFKRYYRPEYCTVLVVGDAKREQVVKLSQQYFGDWERGSFVNSIPSEPQQTGTRFNHLQNGSIPPFLLLSYKGPAFNEDEIDMPTLDVLSSLTFSSTSKLYKKLVIEEQKIRFIGGGALDSRDPNLFNIQVSLINKDDFQYVADEIFKTIEKLKDERVDEYTLDRTKSNLKYSYAMGIDSPTSIANSISHYIQITGDPETVNKVYSQYDKVTVDDIKKIAKKYFTKNGLTISTISADELGGVK
ncbi:MAG: pitrilysin family protein [Melioribacteraceae bacterium]